MQIYWYGILTIVTLSLLKKESAYLIIPFFCILLHYLPDTGRDYLYYELSYMSGAYHSEWPYFRTHSNLTSEPLYRAYTAMIRVLTKFNFQEFLALNFLISMSVIIWAWKNIFRSLYHFPTFLLFFSLVAAPTIFYFSPRSSISFALMMLFFSFLLNKKIIWAILAAFLTISIHSQYLVAIFMLFATYAIIELDLFKRYSPKSIGFIIGVSIFIGLSFSTVLLGVFLNVFSFLPSIDFLASKSQYLSNATKSGFRAASILSLGLYPALLIFAKPALFEKLKINQKPILIYFSAIIFSNMAIILWAFNDPHLSGRLARFTDYFGFSALMPLLFIGYSSRLITTLICLLMAILSPVIFSGLYNFSL